MGYRSDVRIIVSKEGYEELKEYVKEQALKYATEDYDYNLLNHTFRKYTKDNGDQVLLCWEYLKWYDMNEDVKIIMNALDFLDEKGYSYRYARIGENMDDIEELCIDGALDQYLDYPSIIRCFEDSDFSDIALTE